MGRRFGGAAWVLFLSLACAVAVVRAETNAQCARCGKWVKLSDEGSGFARKWEGLCGTCVDPKERCDQAIKDLERRVAELREAAKYWSWAIANPREAGFEGFEGIVPRARFDEAVRNLAEAMRRLAAMKRECKARGAGGAAETAAEGGEGGGVEGGVADAAVDLVRAGAKGMASQLWNQVENAYRGAQTLNQGVAAGAAKVFGVAQKATAAPTAAAQLDAIEGYLRGLVGSSDPPAGAVASEATAGGASTGEGAASPAVESQDGIAEPKLVDLRADLPAERIAKAFALSERHAENAVAYADALRKSVEQVEAARAAGNAERAKRHLDRALYLASMGQKASRQSVAERTAAMQSLHHEATTFVREAKGRTVEEALAAWQAEVRANGLPADYVEKLRKAGVPDEEIAKRRAWLEGVDAKAAARTQAEFVALVAPRYLPAARGRANAPPPLPEADDLWDLVAIMLLEARPAAEGGR